MNKLTLIFLFIVSSIISQNNTEIYLFDITKTIDGYELNHKINISNNKGYDSQPHFYDNNTLLFASSRDGQTDIVKYTIDTGEKKFINYTKNGGEYSPQRIPNSKDISAVRLDNSGLQRLYKYNINTGISEEIIPDLKVAYPLWYNDHVLFSAVIVENALELVKSNNLNNILEKNIGRSLHKIPNTNLISFISKKKMNWEISAVNTSTLSIDKISGIEGNYEDICWLTKEIVLLAKKNQIVQLTISKENIWKEFVNKDQLNLKNISRISVSPNGKKIAIVGE
jgi:hypothetical protein